MFRRTVTARFLSTFMLAGAATWVACGCTVISVTTTAVGVAATGVGLAVDAGVGAARITGKAIGATVDAVTPSSGN